MASITCFCCNIKKADDEPVEIEDAAYEAKDLNMIRNGALLLEKQIAAGHGKGSGSEPLRIFSAAEIEKATNRFDPRLILGQVVATGYKGTLEDGRVVAIKSAPPRLPSNERVIDFFLNQVVVKQMVNHKNVVKLHGCCLETRVPTLVYEFFPNGRVFDQIHGRSASTIGRPIPCFNIPWSGLVKIAAEISHTLSYMHIALPRPIVHMDVKPANIYMDEFFTAKLTNFGFSVSISPGEDFISPEIVGTLGYIDPEYRVTRKVTEKCDVYSFGMTLIEMLTGKSPGLRMGFNWVDYFVWHLNQGGNGLVHPRVLKEALAEEIQAFAGVTVRCVASRGEERPTMREAAIDLRRLHLAVKQRQNDLCSTSTDVEMGQLRQGDRQVL